MGISLRSSGWIALSSALTFVVTGMVAGPKTARAGGEANESVASASTHRSGQMRSSFELNRPRRGPRAPDAQRARHNLDSPARRRSLFPKIDSPAIDLILQLDGPLTELPALRPPEGALASLSLKRPSVARVTSPAGGGALALFDFTRRFGADALKTANHLERFSRRFMRGARLLGGDSETSGDPEQFEARLIPGWRRGPVAQFRFTF